MKWLPVALSLSAVSCTYDFDQFARDPDAGMPDASTSNAAPTSAKFALL